MKAVILAGGLGTSLWQLQSAERARGEALAQAMAYGNVAFLGSVFVWLVNTLASVSRGAGNMAAPSVTLFVVALLQVALGGWVSTNYAVLACSDVPTCQGEWWPPMDFDAGFTLQRWCTDPGDRFALALAVRDGSAPA